MRTVADRYKITSPIGRGGMGQVWEGKDLRLNRRLASDLYTVGCLLYELLTGSRPF